MVKDFKKIEKELDKLKHKKLKEPKVKKLLTNPKTKLPHYSGTKFVKQLASSIPQREVQEYQPREIVNDNRSLFFNDEFKNERKEGMKWLGN